MLVVHVSRTPLAGSPIRIVRALNAHTDVRARSINLARDAYGTRTFPEDLVWDDDRDEAATLIEQADIVHFHHWFDADSRDNPFAFDFGAAMKKDALRLMHWHSSPAFLAKMAGCAPRQLVEHDVPQLVVAQYHEPYYPNARPVPLIVEQPPAMDDTPPTNPPTVFFSPTRLNSAHSERWETKGKPEVMKVLTKLARSGSLRPRVVHQAPFDACQELMRQSDIVIDDVVTGSFHTTGLEGLAAGKSTLAFVDSRTQLVLAELTGSTDLPFVNVRLDELADVLRALCADRDLLEALGQHARDWMATHYREADMVAHYVDSYEELARTGTLTNPRYAEHARARAWLYQELPDLIWSSRKKNLYPGAVGRAVKRPLRMLRNLATDLREREPSPPPDSIEPRESEA